jgi:hypothetical protein
VARAEDLEGGGVGGGHFDCCGFDVC